MYSLRRSQKILHNAFRLYKKKDSDLSEKEREKLVHVLRKLEDAVFEKNREQASAYAMQAEELSHTHFKKKWWEKGIEITLAIVFALIIATIIRQVWFELYEIPTGSMRPSFREQDRLSVTKTPFGINVPLFPNHFIFDPDLVERGKVIIFSGHNIPLPDTDTTYFGILPYKKRYIKRLIGKPGDSLYFYGGNIYGIDKSGSPLTELLEDPWMRRLEHIPFITFEGEISSPKKNEILFQQMRIPTGKLAFTPFGSVFGKVYDGKEWKKDNPLVRSSSEVETVGDLWGIKNFAMARLMTKEQLMRFSSIDPETLEPADLYLQMRHSPNLTYPTPKIYREGGFYGVKMPTFEAIIPLTNQHLEQIKNHLYTSRMEIKRGELKRYGASDKIDANERNLFSQVPDGTYEFTNGIAEQIRFQGIATQLPKNHPLYDLNTQQIQELFNMGITMHGGMSQETFYQHYYPHRYAYFRDGELYLMGAKIFERNDPSLMSFIQSEKQKASRSTPDNPYLPFIDNGPPLIEGKLDIDKIKTFGLKIPENSYLVLGDNHAMSADSRVFGFVPQENLEGSPSLILWPPGKRWGAPPQSAYPIVVMPRLIIWAIAAIIFAIWYFMHRKKMNTRLFPHDEENR